MKPIRLTKHAVEQSAERGASETEVRLAIQNAIWEPARGDRYTCKYNFEYNRAWQGSFYAVKKVSPIFVESDTEIIVITVYTFYF